MRTRMHGHMHVHSFCTEAASACPRLLWVCACRAQRPKGFAFVEFDNATAAQNAISSMNGFQLMGRTIKVTLLTLARVHIHIHTYSYTETYTYTHTYTQTHIYTHIQIRIHM
jgi:RNA recognition motif-containing protein